MIQIQGQKVFIRDWLPQDLEIYKNWQMGAQEWKKFDAPYYQSDDQDFLKSFEAWKAKVEARDFPTPRGRLVIASLENNQLVGTLNAYWISKETNWLAAGIVLFDPKSWSGGIGTEALSLWIDYLFENRPELVRMDLHTWSGNEKMVKLAKRLGFQLEGRFRKARIVNGQYFDSMQFGILREEWRNPQL
ncbi:MAG: GNAT family N-acetyltransferase [Pseudobdellovibrionaceae bacterium]